MKFSFLSFFRTTLSWNRCHLKTSLWSDASSPSTGAKGTFLSSKMPELIKDWVPLTKDTEVPASGDAPRLLRFMASLIVAMSCLTPSFGFRTECKSLPNARPAESGTFVCWRLYFFGVELAYSVLMKPRYSSKRYRRPAITFFWSFWLFESSLIETFIWQVASANRL